MRRDRNAPVEYEGTTYESIRELARLRFGNNYSLAYQTVFRYEKRRNRAVVWNGVTYGSLAEMGRALGFSRERARQLINERDNEQAQS